MSSTQRRVTSLVVATITVGGLLTTIPAIPNVVALPCPDGTQTCGPTAPTFDPGPTQGGGTTAPGAPQTTIPPNVDTGLPQAPTATAPNDGGNIHVQTPDFGPTSPPPDCILNCDVGTPAPTQVPTVTATPKPTTVAPTTAPTLTSPPSGVITTTVQLPPTTSAPGRVEKTIEQTDRQVYKSGEDNCGFTDWIGLGSGFVGGLAAMGASTLVTPLGIGVPLLGLSTVATAGAGVGLASCVRRQNDFAY